MGTSSIVINAYNSPGVAKYMAKTQVSIPQLGRFARKFSMGVPVLDAGCGVGRDVFRLRNARLNAFGIDAAEAMINHGKDNYQDILPWLSLMDIKEIKFDDNTFFGIWCRGVIQHLPIDDAQVVSNEFHRVLSPGGTLFIRTQVAFADILEPKERYPRALTQEGKVEAILPFKIQLKGDSEPVQIEQYCYVRTYSPEMLTSILLEAGFTNRNIKIHYSRDELDRAITWINAWAIK